MSQLTPLLEQLKASGAERAVFLPNEDGYAVDGDQRWALPGGPNRAATLIEAVAELLSYEDIKGISTTRPRVVRHEHDGDSFVLEIMRQEGGVALAIRLASKGARPVQDGAQGLDRAARDQAMATRITVETASAARARTARAAAAAAHPAAPPEPPRAGLEEALELARHVAEEAARGVARSTAEEAARGVARSTAEEAARGVARSTAEEAARGVARSTAEEAARGVARSTAEEVARGVAEEAARGAAVELAEEAIRTAAHRAIAEALRAVGPRGKPAPGGASHVARRGGVEAARAPAKIDALLREMIQRGASDLHLTAGNQPVFRVDGQIHFSGDRAPVSSAEVQAMIDEITTPRARDDFEALRDADFAYEIPELARFRVNVFEDRNGTGAVLRQIPIEILSAEQLGLPKACLDLCWLTKGLVLVTGPTGSGKSTTLAAMIDFINANRSDHIITIEDPVEFVHPNKRCLVNQREIGQHTQSFKNALRAALREDPDIVLVGEMRDLETISIAIETAETGHLVFGTLHTTTAISTVDRIIDQFPADRQDQIRVMLSESLKGVIAQTLLPKIGGGRVAAYEILLANHAVASLIREGKTFQLTSVMQTGKAHGMVTLNDSLLSLVQRKIVDPKQAYVKAVDKSGFSNMLRAAGIAPPV